MSRRPLASVAVNGHGAASPQDAAQAHAAAVALRSSFQRLAALHLDLAAAYGDLAANAEAGLAVLAQESVHALVPSSPRFLTPKQTAEVLGCHPRSLRRKELAGEIPPPIGEGKAKRWRQADLEGWGS